MKGDIFIEVQQETGSVGCEIWTGTKEQAKVQVTTGWEAS
jgi:uncharacterized protein YuzE